MQEKIVDVPARQVARQSVDYFINRHMLHSFRDAQDDLFKSHAKKLRQELGVMYNGEVGKIVEAMNGYAAQIAELELHDPAPNGHHEKAALEIHKLAEILTDETCPWRDLVHLFKGNILSRYLATALWQQNKKLEKTWTADLQSVCESVWGDPLTSDATVRVSITRLVAWLADRGVRVNFEVDCDANPSHIRCEVLNVDEAKIAELFDEEVEARTVELEKNRQSLIEED